MTDCDVLLIGAGHNGLACAHALARSGKKVLVLEAGSSPGGCAATREFHPGFSVSACAQWLNQFSPEVFGDMKLEQHGLSFAARDLASVSLGGEAGHLVLRGGSVGGAGVTARDRSAYADFHAKMLKYSRLLARACTARVPKLVEANAADRLMLLRLGLALRLLGRTDMRELMRILLINMYDLMEEHFEHAALKALLSLDGILGAHAGPRSPGTVFNFLYRQMGEVFGYCGPAQVRTGMGGLGNAMAASARSAGAEILCDSNVVRIIVESGRAMGATLDSGEQLRSKLVVSNVDPVNTFERLVGFRHMETGMVRRISHIRYRSGTAKLHLALSGLPDFSGLDTDLVGQRLVIAPDMDLMERAFNAVKYREYSRAPLMDISIPTVNDESLAPAGQHVLSAMVQFAPYNPQGGWEAHRGPFLEILLDLLEYYAPGLRAQVLAAELLTPQDLEREFGMRGGNWHHGELALDQILMMRPVSGTAQYSTPIEGLYLCGAGAHPGGGLMGLAGRNAAREILRQGTAA